MLDFEEAVSRVLSDVPLLDRERLPLRAADGRVLGEAVHARADLPPFDTSAMDGYAVRTADLGGDGPFDLPVAGESRTGHPAPVLAPASACRIFTGAVLPAGADAVVMQEQVERDGDRARLQRRPKPYDHVRRAGEELRSGALALEAGTRLGPAQLGLLAALDQSEVIVRRRPAVTILCTGDELRPPGSPAFEGSIPESNGVALGALAARCGATVRLSPLARDELDATESAVRDALSKSDLLLTVGGVSVGDHDLVRDALEAAGVTLDFWKVRIKPGKPLAYGAGAGARVLGLPGNPVSALVTFALFGAPLLRAMQGDRNPLPAYGRAELAAPIVHSPGRLGFYRVRLEGSSAVPLENQSSGAMSSMAWADALAVVPAAAERVAAGEWVRVLRLDDL